ncbi:MAG: polysaccharide biosynthesis/export family protein [Cyclobacteriaceae bacterium]
MITTAKKKLRVDYLLIVLIILTNLFSCVPNKQVIYFQNPELNTSKPIDIINSRNVYRLQPRDIISVRIKTIDEETTNFFNLENPNSFQQFNPAALYLNGYSLDEEGYINLPEAGRVLLGGMTINDAQQRVQEAMSDYLNNASIIVKLISFKITVLGEVNQPGYYYVFNDQANIFEGLGLAGDLTDFGNRENITLVRQTLAGSQAVLIDLKDPDLLASEYYFLQPNDVIYVQPLKAKNTRANLNTFTLLSVLFGAVSSAVLVLNFVNRQ